MGISSFCLDHQRGAAAAGLVFFDHDLPVDAFLQLRHMGDDTHQPVALRQSRKGIVSLAQGLRIQRAKTFIHEQCIQPDAGGHLHLVGKTQRQRQGCQEGLAAGKGIDTSLGGIDVVDDIQFQAALLCQSL